MREPAQRSWGLFWGSLALILYTYIGYPLLLALRAWLLPRPLRRAGGTPRVSMIVAAHNEEAIITQKLDNTMALDYPKEQMEVIVASDGSDDRTNELVRAYPSPLVRLLALPRQGKNRTLNEAVAIATGEILVFSDADSMLQPEALRHLVAPFADPEVGGVGGDFHYTTERADGQEGVGERSYWSFDRVIKQFQSRAGNMTSATGQIYAIRRELFRPVPDNVTDDFYISVQVPAQHRRLLFEPRAVAYGSVAASTGAEFQRKVRVLVAGLNGVWLNRSLLNPARYGFYAIQLLSHKLLRRLMVLPLSLLFLSAPLLWQRGWFYRLAALGQAALHGAALLGLLLRDHRLGRSRLLALPLFLDMVNVAAVVAIFRLLRGERRDIWVPQRAVMTSGEGE